jgi:predicted dehydrogenase
MFSRRDFVRGSLGVAAGLSAGAGLPLLADQAVAKKKAGPNDRINVCIMGIRGRGQAHLGAFLGHKDTTVTALCDVDSRLFADSAKTVEDKTGRGPRCEQDIRRILEDKNIDVISIATTNHWHALGTIWAIQAGKDVYVEKPVSHNVSEGRRMVEFARHHKKIVQTGTQSRSDGGVRQAIEFLRSGQLGKVQIARALCYKRRTSIGKVTGEQEIPKEIDYDLWLGPAPKRPLTRKNLHYDWHWVWDYGNGDLGNQGIHQMDVARWGLGVKALAKGVQSLGGRFGYVDDGETPNTQLVFLDYGDQQLVFEVRGLETKGLLGAKIGNIFHCSDGYLVIGAEDKTPPTAYTLKGEKIQTFRGGGENHFANFVKAVQSRNVSDLNADIEEGHLSSALCHLGNISYRLGTQADFNPRTKAFGDDKDAYDTLARMEEHLTGNHIKLNETRYQLGRKLAIDTGAETFVNDKEADALLTRPYRPPFVVLAKV